MKHTSHADFALRVLLYLRVAPGRRGSVGDIAVAHRISRHHLDKVVQRLAGAGLVETTRGRGGGVALARDPATMTVGEIMRAMESDSLFSFLLCFRNSLQCVLSLLLSFLGFIDCFFHHNSLTVVLRHKFPENWNRFTSELLEVF